MPVEDAEISAFARKQLEKQGMKIMTGAKVTKVEKGADSVTATCRDSRTARRKSSRPDDFRRWRAVGNIENIGLEALGVKTDRGCIVIDGYGKHQCAGHLRHWRCRRPAHAGAQGRARGRDLRREDRRPANVHPMDKRRSRAAPTATRRSPPSV
jgi:dihydrolipoamide dehydrogenase